MKKNNSSSLNILAVVLTLGLVIIAWKLISPSYASNSQSLKSLENEITNAQAKLDSLDKTRNDLSTIESTYNIISVAIPEDNDEPNLITELEAIAVKNSLTIPSISISGESEETAAYEDDGLSSYNQTGTPISINMSVSGTFEQLNEFIGALEKSVKFMNITDLNFAYSEDGGLSLSISIEAYKRSSINDESENGVYSETGEAL